MELRDALVKLKARATAVQQEKAQVQALLTAASPDQTRRLVAEIGTLRERMGAFLAQKACSAHQPCSARSHLSSLRRLRILVHQMYLLLSGPPASHGLERNRGRSSARPSPCMGMQKFRSSRREPRDHRWMAHTGLACRFNISN